MSVERMKGSWARIEEMLSKRWVAGAVILAAIAIGVWSAWPHMDEAIWQDEAATLSFHVSRGVVDPFLHYMSPNSHVGFTSMLAAWLKLFRHGVDIPALRALPLLLFLGAIPMAYLAARRLGGSTVATVSTLFFAGSIVAANFSTQLRGYGPSWLFMSAALFCALAARERRVWLLGYLFVSVCAVAILPTNLYFLFLISMAAVFAQPEYRSPSSRRELFFALVSIPPLALLIAYGAIWRELMSYAGVDFSPWSRGGLLWEWLRGSLSNLGWLLPLVGAGFACLVLDLGRRRRVSDPLLAGAVLIFGMVLLVVVMPNPPFPRTLVPYLPVWIAGICAVAASAVRPIRSRIEGAAVTAGALLFGALLFVGPAAQSCTQGKSVAAKFEYDLCHQYFRDEYHPSAVMDAWADQPTRLPIVSDFEGYHALRILGAPAQVFEFRNIDRPLDNPPLFVAHDRVDAETMMEKLGLDPHFYGLVADTGYFKVYAPERLP